MNTKNKTEGPTTLIDVVNNLGKFKRINKRIKRRYLDLAIFIHSFWELCSFLLQSSYSLCQTLKVV